MYYFQLPNTFPNSLAVHGPWIDMTESQDETQVYGRGIVGLTLEAWLDACRGLSLPFSRYEAPEISVGKSKFFKCELMDLVKL